MTLLARKVSRSAVPNGGARPIRTGRATRGGARTAVRAQGLRSAQPGGFNLATPVPREQCVPAGSHPPPSHPACGVGLRLFVALHGKGTLRAGGPGPSRTGAGATGTDRSVTSSLVLRRSSGDTAPTAGSGGTAHASHAFATRSPAPGGSGSHAAGAGCTARRRHERPHAGAECHRSQIDTRGTRSRSRGTLHRDQCQGPGTSGPNHRPGFVLRHCPGRANLRHCTLRQVLHARRRGPHDA